MPSWPTRCLDELDARRSEPIDDGQHPFRRVRFVRQEASSQPPPHQRAFACDLCTACITPIGCQADSLPRKRVTASIARLADQSWLGGPGAADPLEVVGGRDLEVGEGTRFVRQSCKYVDPA